MHTVAHQDTGQVIIDVGAFLGVFIDDRLRQQSVARVHAFEPLSANYAFLKQKYQGDDRVTVFQQAVSNFTGQTKLFKKPYVRRVLGIPYKTDFDFAGNAGSSLKHKSNVSRDHFERVAVVSLSDFIRRNDLSRINVLKIDSEGSEYDILHDLLDNDLLDRIDQIFFEDHVRKVPEIAASQRAFVQRVKGTPLESKFFVQDVVTGNDLAYLPLAEVYDREFFKQAA